MILAQQVLKMLFRAWQIIFKQWTPTYGMKSYAVRERTLEKKFLYVTGNY